jgi:amino acid transporter
LTTRRFAYVVLASEEIVAVSNLIAFEYNDGRTNLRWAVGNDVNPLVWIALFLVIVTVINMFPVKV